MRRQPKPLTEQSPEAITTAIEAQMDAVIAAQVKAANEVAKETGEPLVSRGRHRKDGYQLVRRLLEWAIQDGQDWRHGTLARIAERTGYSLDYVSRVRRDLGKANGTFVPIYEQRHAAVRQKVEALMAAGPLPWRKLQSWLASVGFRGRTAYHWLPRLDLGLAEIDDVLLVVPAAEAAQRAWTRDDQRRIAAEYQKSTPAPHPTVDRVILFQLDSTPYYGEPVNPTVRLVPNRAPTHRRRAVAARRPANGRDVSV